MDKDLDESAGADSLTLKPIDTMYTEHVEKLSAALSYRFAVSESGFIGISGVLVKPPLVVVYPNSRQAPMVLSDDKSYCSVIFMTISDKEYLLAACRTDNNIHLWNLESSTVRVVHKLEKDTGVWQLCSIDKTSVGCWQEQPSHGFHKICVLNTEAKQWNVARVVVMIEGLKHIFDTCSMRTEDGTNCLVLCSYRDQCAQAVEALSGKIRWTSDKTQMGEHYFTLSICVYQNNTVCIIDFAYKKLLLLSSEDGSIVRSVYLGLYGITQPICAHLQGEYIYVGHVDESDKIFEVLNFSARGLTCFASIGMAHEKMYCPQIRLSERGQ